MTINRAQAAVAGGGAGVLKKKKKKKIHISAAQKLRAELNANGPLPFHEGRGLQGRPAGYNESFLGETRRRNGTGDE